MKPDDKIYIEELRKRLAERKRKAAEGEIIIKENEDTTVSK